MEQAWLSPEQIADQLGLHVRTIRSYIRDGRLNATRIGKQYRVARADLDAFTGRPAPAPTVEVSTVVEIEDLPPAAADRLGTVLLAGGQLPGDRATRRVQTIYDSSRRRLRVIILGSAAATADLLHTLDALLAAGSGLLGTPETDHD